MSSPQLTSSGGSSNQDSDQDPSTSTSASLPYPSSSCSRNQSPSTGLRRRRIPLPSPLKVPTSPGTPLASPATTPLTSPLTPQSRVKALDSNSSPVFLEAKNSPLSPGLYDEMLFNNWGLTVQKKTRHYRKPTTIEEIKEALEEAVKIRQAGEPIKVRAKAHGHSWTELFIDDKDFLLDVSDLQFEPVLDRETMTVRISPACSVQTLLDFFLAQGVCFYSDVIIQEVRYGGLVATGSHGTCRDRGTVSDSMVAMSIMQITNDFEVVHKTYRDPLFWQDKGVSVDNTLEEWQALKLNLGLCGIMTELVLKVEPTPTVIVDNYRPPVNEYFPRKGYNNKLKELVTSKFAVELFWFPFDNYPVSWRRLLGYTALPGEKQYDPIDDDRLWIKVFDKEKAEEVQAKDTTPSIFYSVQRVLQYLGINFCKAACRYVVSRWQFLTPYWIGWSSKFATGSSSYPQTLPRAIHYQAWLDEWKLGDMEFCFRCNKDFHNIIDAHRICIELVSEWEKEGRFPVNVAMESRFIRASDALISPAYSDDPEDFFCYLEVVAGVHSDGWKEFCMELARRWYEVDGVVGPHWAKEFASHSEDPVENLEIAAQKVKDHYPRLQDFKRVRNEMDPHRMFTNKWLESVLSL